MNRFSHGLLFKILYIAVLFAFVSVPLKNLPKNQNPFQLFGGISIGDNSDLYLQNYPYAKFAVVEKTFSEADIQNSIAIPCPDYLP